MLCLSLLLIVIGCRQAEYNQAGYATKLAPAPQRSEWSIDTTGNPYQLHLTSDRLTFCDDRGARTLNL